MGGFSLSLQACMMFLSGHVISATGFMFLLFGERRVLCPAAKVCMRAVQRVEIALEVVDGHPCHSGWAAVIFPSAQDVAEYLPT